MQSFFSMKPTGLNNSYANITLPGNNGGTAQLVMTSPSNDWSTTTLQKYFAITIPLILGTVCVPLVFIAAFTYVVKKASQSRFREVAFWGWTITTFVLNLTWDIYDFVQSSRNHNDYNFGLPIQAVTLITQLITIFHWVYQVWRERSTRKRWFKKRILWLLLWITFVAAFAIRLGTGTIQNLYVDGNGGVHRSRRGYPFIELVPYVILFFVMMFRGFRSKWIGKRGVGLEKSEP
jgi:hypothetical protein